MTLYRIKKLENYRQQSKFPRDFYSFNFHFAYKQGTQI